MRRRLLLAVLPAVVWALGSCAAVDSTPPALVCAAPFAGAGPDFRTLDELDEALRRGAETVAARVAAVDSRVQRLDQACFALNAVSDWNPEAGAIAAALDARSGIAGQAPEAQPLFGVPILIKANIDTGDNMSTHAGARALASRRAADDSDVAAALRASGAVIVGKANLSEWANFRSQNSVSGWSSVAGQTRNPHVLDRNPCGSSSGSAVAVAAGLVPVAIGTETNGSIVCPAGVNGVVGFKPTQGRVSGDGIVPIAPSHDIAGPLARSVRDAARVASVITVDGEDLEARLAVDALVGKRIAVWRGHYGAGDDPRLEQIFDDALKALTAAGATLIDPLGYEIDSAISEASFAVLLHEFNDSLAAYLAAPDNFDGPDTLAAIMAYNDANAATTMPWFGQDLLQLTLDKGELDPQAYAAALSGSRDRLRDELQALRASHGFDAVIALTNAPAWPIDAVAGDRFALGSASLAAISGWPTVSLPAGQIMGLPVGVSLTAPAQQDAALLAMAFALEQRLPPPVRPAFRPSLESAAALRAAGIGPQE